MNCVRVNYALVSPIYSNSTLKIIESLLCSERHRMLVGDPFVPEILSYLCTAQQYFVWHCAAFLHAFGVVASVGIRVTTLEVGSR